MFLTRCLMTEKSFFDIRAAITRPVPEEFFNESDGNDDVIPNRALIPPYFAGGKDGDGVDDGPGAL